MRPALQTVTVLATSLILHGLAFAAIGIVRVPVFDPPERNEVAFEVEDPPPAPEPPPPPPPPPPPEVEPPRPTVREAPAREAPEETPPETPPPPPAPVEEEPVNFDGVTLSSENGDPSFTMNQGTGQHMTGPQRAGNGTRHVDGDPNGIVGGTGTAPAAAGPRMVPVADLSRRPAPPGTDRVISAMMRNYPRDAREEGIEQHAVVRMQIGADGRLSRLRIISGAEHGFGEACRQSLMQSGNWSPPLDRNGQAVATEVTFDCDFQVRSF